MSEKSQNIHDILKLLPHRYPFLMVDRVVEVVPGEKIRAYKNVTYDEPFFQGHFPADPVMPGVLIIEALAQAGGLIVLNYLPAEDLENKLFFFTAIENAKFRRPVVPGDRLDLHCHIVRHKFKLWRIRGEAFVDGNLAAEADLSAVMVDKGSY